MMDDLPSPTDFARIDIIESLDDHTMFDVVGVNYTDNAIVNTLLAGNINRALAEAFVKVYCESHWEKLL